MLHLDDEFSIQQLDEVLKDIQVASACFAHTLQLCIKDGLKPATALLSTIQEAVKLVKHVKKSTMATEKIETLFGKTLVSRNQHVGTARLRW